LIECLNNGDLPWRQRCLNGFRSPSLMFDV
jgi:hypothetical protein